MQNEWHFFFGGGGDGGEGISIGLQLIEDTREISIQL